MRTVSPAPGIAPLCLPLEERLDLVEAFVSDSGLRTSVQTELRHIPDLHRLSRRLVAHKASLQVGVWSA